jgi:hypothetical protein
LVVGGVSELISKFEWHLFVLLLLAVIVTLLDWGPASDCVTLQLFFTYCAAVFIRVLDQDHLISLLFSGHIRQAIYDLIRFVNPKFTQTSKSDRSRLF